MSDLSFSLATHSRLPLSKIDEDWLSAALSDDEIEEPAETRAEDADADCDEDDRESARPGEEDLTWEDLGLDKFIVPVRHSSDRGP